MKRKWQWVSVALVATVLSGVLASTGLARNVLPAWVFANPDRRDADYFTNLPLVTSTGETVEFFDDLLEGKIVAIQFMYTECLDMCSLSTARLAQLYTWLGERMGHDIHFVSISLDPEKDTPEKLAAFAESFGAGKGWTFVTGERQTIDVIRHKLGERARNLSEHRSDMVIGNALTGVWRRTSVMGSLAVTLQTILELDPNHDRVAQISADRLKKDAELTVSYDLRNHPGEGIFLRACASCHTIGEGVKYAPDLQAVTLRRSPDWLARFIAKPDRMLAEKDPIAVALDAGYPAIQMPNLGLGPDDVADVLTYLRAADAKLARDENDQSEAYLEFEKVTGGMPSRIDVYLSEPDQVFD
jgi:protein SCO1/2